MAELYSRDPGYRERLEIALEGLLGGGRQGARRARNVTGLLDFVPFVGGGLGASDARDAFNRGDLLEGGLLAGTTVLGAVPVVGPSLAKAAKSGGRRLLFDAPYSNYKIDPDLPGLLAEQTKVVPTSQYVPERVISPETLSSDGFLLNLVGDRTNVGEITRLGGRDLDQPITLDGGRGYMRGKGTGAWASEGNKLRPLSLAAQSAEGRPVYGTYVAMSGTGSDFANMTRAVAMKDFDPANLLKKDIKDFDKRFRAAKAYDYDKIRKDYPGIASPKLDEWLDKTGTNRAAFFDFMDKAEWRDKGFPNVTEARFVIQDPALRNLPAGNEVFGGQSIARIDEAGTTRPTSGLLMPHGTYDTDLAGDYLGGFEMGIPRSVLFPEFIAARRAAGTEPSGDNRSFAFSPILQPTNQEWLDGVMKYLESNRGR